MCSVGLYCTIAVVITAAVYLACFPLLLVEEVAEASEKLVTSQVIHVCPNSIPIGSSCLHSSSVNMKQGVSLVSQEWKNTDVS